MKQEKVGIMFPWPKKEIGIGLPGPPLHGGTDEKNNMIRHGYGYAPFLECSSKGEKRLSAFYARPWPNNTNTIEQLYQARKKFEDGSSGLSIKEAKGKVAINQRECSEFYSLLWTIYIANNPELLVMIKRASGLSDIFGQEGHCCQATELWRIRNKEKV